MILKMKAWIRSIDEDKAEGELAKIYDNVRETRGSVSNVMKVHSLDPESIRLHLQLYLHLLYGRSSLTRVQREMIVVIVSHLNNCEYCVTHHDEALRAHTRSHILVKSLQGDFTKATISSRDRSMLAYASKLTRQPNLVSEKDVRAMREEGFTDEEILRINLITSYFNFVNRIVTGLGISLEEAKERVYKY